MLEEKAAANIVLKNIELISRSRIDRECTIKALEDPKIDYETKREYNNDIIGDDRCIETAINNIGPLFESYSTNDLILLMTDVYDLAKDKFKQKTIEKNIK